MQATTPTAWLPGAVVSQYLRFICPEGFATANRAQSRILGVAAYWTVTVLAMVWLKLVTKNVPEPYLDEIFHIPQAQLYCNGKYDYWDPKLTTPPGLYVFATLFTKLRYGEYDVFGLRLFNATVLPILFLSALSCRHLITNSRPKFHSISPDSVHTALNIALFPPIFFFSGLFYTDLLSTCVVLVTYRIFLRSGNVGTWAVYPAGLVALTMRQTNIFWVAIFLGGLEVTRTITESSSTQNNRRISTGPWKERIKVEIERWGGGNIHDPPLAVAGVHDFVLCAISIAVAIIYQPIEPLRKLAPYIALLMSFGSFVHWNGGVVLGDKSNHVATIHLPQLFYLFGFTAFFSLPLLISPTLEFLWSLLSLLRLPVFPRLKWQYLLTSGYCVGALLGTLVIVRHYVFYVFRYTILRHPLIRFLLAPVYLVCGWAVYLTLCGTTSGTSSKFDSTQRTKSNSIKQVQESETPKNALKENDSNENGPTVSFLLIFLLTTALSLITAPLVEPRYFIIPWVIWRLHVPSLPAQKLSAKAQKTSNTKSHEKPSKTKEGFLQTVKHVTFQSHDYRLWLETFYFLAINAVTGYIFLYRGFAWPQEPGNVQRFMW